MEYMINQIKHAYEVKELSRLNLTRKLKTLVDESIQEGKFSVEYKIDSDMPDADTLKFVGSCFTVKGYKFKWHTNQVGYGFQIHISWA